MKNDNRPIRIALIGAGTVGSKVASLLIDQAEDLKKKYLDKVGLLT